MSWVAEAKATMMNRMISAVIPQNGRQRAVTVTVTAIRIWVSRIHQRLERKMSMKGLHSGLISQGRLIRVVSGPSVPLSMPRSLKTASATVLTIA